MEKLQLMDSTILFTILLVKGFLEYRFPQLGVHGSPIIGLYKELRRSIIQGLEIMFT